MERNANSRGEDAATPPALLPPVDVLEDAQGITLYADLPGVPKDKLHLEVDGEQLILEGEMDLSIPPGMDATHAEVGLSRYRRVFTLSKELDSSRLQAELKQGVLKLRIQKLARATARRIDVRAG